MLVLAREYFKQARAMIANRSDLSIAMSRSPLSTTVEKALRLLEALALADEPVGPTDLGRELRLNKSTVHRLLATLQRRGYVRQDAKSGHYRLTLKLWELGAGVVEGLGLREAARPVLESVAEETQETTLLGVLQAREAIVVDKVESTRPLRIASPIGERLPLSSCALGRALLAFQPEALIDEFKLGFAPRGAHGVASAAELHIELARIRTTECASSYDEWQEGVAAVAAPVRDASGAVIASFCITGPTSRLLPDGLDALGERCVVAARRISRLLGLRSAQGARSVSPKDASAAISGRSTSRSKISAITPVARAGASRQ